MKIRFDRFVLDSAARRLTRDGAAVHLSPKAFDLLVLLVEARPAVVEKAAIRGHLWPGVHVVDASLSNLVTEIRTAVDDGREASWIRTVHGVGYAFADDATDVRADTRRAGTAAALCWVMLDTRRIPLPAGVHVIGRDASCGVWIDSGDVSRRHARLVVDAEGPAVAVTVEDAGSTNGTYVRGRRIATKTTLRDGDRVRIGDVTITFRTREATDAPTRRVKR
jgi:DNA-binding winged helix-turn-helix (wHTH) protein